MRNRILVFEESHPTGGNCRVTLTEQQAIDWAKREYEYGSDEEALGAFIVEHWAWYKDEECE